MKKLLLPSSILLLFACSTIDDYKMQDSDPGVSKTITQVIPPEEALDNLATLMDGIYGSTKSMPFDARDLQVFGGVQTKSGEISIPDTSVYILNFPDNSGYAVMAAQRCMTTPVFCITESGSLSASDMQEAMTMLEQQDALTRSEDETDSNFVDTGEKFAHMLITAAAVNQMNTSGKLPDDTEWTELFTYNIITKIGPLLETKWYQKGPFNTFRSDDAPAGCVAVAVAQILACNELSTLPYATFDWDLLKTVCPYNDYTNAGTKEATAAASEFLEIVGNPSNCNISYGANGSSGNTNGAVRTFKNFGYETANKNLGFNSSDMNRVTTMLCNMLPVYTDGSNGIHGHAWVIDGLLVRDKIRNGSVEILNSGSAEVVKRENLFHINWGWNGKNDGYYERGVFDSTKRITQDEMDKNDDTVLARFTWDYATVTYSLY